MKAGVARTRITPYRGVELTGWGYYIERRWKRIRDHLNATALVLDDGKTQIAIVALDLMVIDAAFATRTCDRIAAETGIPAHAVLLACSHSHNAPAAGGLLGVGECDPFYEEWASRQAASAVALAFDALEPARLASGHGELHGATFNRTRDAGPVDPTVTVLRVDRLDGSPLSTVVNFQAHPTVHTVLRPWDVTRDVPGEVCDHLEAALPGSTALYLQGACGDVNFLRRFSDPLQCREPGRLVAGVALQALVRADPMIDPALSAAVAGVNLPTRRWTRAEIDFDRDEALRRLRTGDVSGWRDTIGRVMTNNPADMVARHGGDELKAVRAMCRFNLEWTDRMLVDLVSRPEHVVAGAQALGIGDLAIVANGSEFFSTLALDVRARRPRKELMIACYSNGRIGYLPDAHDIARRTYAAYQSPKYCNQFPFVDAAGPAMCDALVRLAGPLPGR